MMRVPVRMRQHVEIIISGFQHGGFNFIDTRFNLGGEPSANRRNPIDEQITHHKHPPFLGATRTSKWPAER
jgi:hypothetical protein